MGPIYKTGLHVGEEDLGEVTVIKSYSSLR